MTIRTNYFAFCNLVFRFFPATTVDNFANNYFFIINMVEVHNIVWEHKATVVARGLLFDRTHPFPKSNSFSICLIDIFLAMSVIMFFDCFSLLFFILPRHTLIITAYSVLIFVCLMYI